LVALEPEETNGRIVSAGGEAQKSVLPFCRVTSGIAAVRRWHNRSRNWGKRKEAKCEEYCCEYGFASFHNLIFFVV
jgi:hypothetical protein